MRPISLYLVLCVSVRMLSVLTLYWSLHAVGACAMSGSRAIDPRALTELARCRTCVLLILARPQAGTMLFCWLKLEIMEEVCKFWLEKCPSRGF